MREEYLRLKKEVLRRLKEAYPNNKFRVSIGRAGLSTSIIVKTDLIKPVPYEDEMLMYDWMQNKVKTREEAERAARAREQLERNRDISFEIKRLLKDIGHVSYDPVSGESLLGGNIYIEVEPLEKRR